jgi:undecaprenyl phosphate-alpha-L-ara4N flippase subunit ArnE
VNPAAFLLLACCIACETIEQLLYRGAATGSIWQKLLQFIAPGIGFHFLRIGLWLSLLRMLPLGVALPLTGLTSVTIAVSAAWIYHEPVTPRRWLGTLLIVIGFAMVTASGG